ncbi:MAG: 30S ribosomal protein S20 [Sedimentisphaerales bacterium]|nr:30S ribosomal protein S20 [Sedimentisphaerales bacterium]
MAHSLSAKKRVRQDEKRRQINRARKSMVKTQIKRFEDAVRSGDLAKAEQEYKLVQIKLDKVSSTSTMHKHTAARIKSRLSRKLNEIKTKTA